MASVERELTYRRRRVNEETIKRPTALAATIAGVFVLVAAALLLVSGGGAAGAPSAVDAAGSGDAVGEDPRILGERGSSDVTFVEFLDFECEACGAAYPVVEQVREKYAGQVTSGCATSRFPATSTPSALRGRWSPQRQGKPTDMYNLMFTTQKDWAEQQEPKDELFRSYAESLGLDGAVRRRLPLPGGVRPHPG